MPSGEPEEDTEDAEDKDPIDPATNDNGDRPHRSDGASLLYHEPRRSSVQPARTSQPELYVFSFLSSALCSHCALVLRYYRLLLLRCAL